MPKKMEEALMKEARKKGYRKGSDAWNRYVYGTMEKAGKMPKKKKGKK